MGGKGGEVRATPASSLLARRISCSLSSTALLRRGSSFSAAACERCRADTCERRDSMISLSALSRSTPWSDGGRSRTVGKEEGWYPDLRSDGGRLRILSSVVIIIAAVYGGGRRLRRRRGDDADASVVGCRGRCGSQRRISHSQIQL